MTVTSEREATWICDPRFAGKTPINRFGRELDPKGPELHDPNLRNHHMLVRHKVTLTAEDLKDGVLLDITADDYYKLYVNGTFVSQGPAQGYHFRHYFNRLELTGYLKPGVNVLAVHVYYQGLVNRAYTSGDYRQGLWAELKASDGRILAATDGTWRIAEAEEYAGPHAATFGYETQFLEHIDARRHRVGWREADYDDAGWGYAGVRMDDDHGLVLQPTPPLSVYRRAPAQVVRRGPNRYWIDFGQEVTGVFTMRACGRAGEQLEIHCGEELQAGSLDVRDEMRCNCVYRETWTLSGGDDELQPFDYKAFRYVEVLGPEEALQPESFAAIVQHYPYPEDAMRFASADETLNRVIELCKNGVIYGTQEHYTDCPSREKGQYLGDNTVTAFSHLLLTGDLRMVRKALEDFAASTAICSGMMAVAPGHYMQEIADYSLLYPRQLLDYYRHSGDLDFLREMAPVAEGIVDYFARYRRTDGLLEQVTEQWNLVDWPANQRDGYDFELSKPIGPGCHNVVNAFYYGALCDVDTIRELLGQPSLGLRDTVRAAFQAAFWRPALGLFADAEHSGHASLHGNTLPLLFDLVPDGGRDSVVSFLKGKRLACGVYFAYFYLKAMARAGEHAFAYSLLVTEEPHELPGPSGPFTVHGYWTQMLREGGTTCFESWSKELKWNTSLCHPWASAPIRILIEDILGLQPAEPGWEQMTVHAAVAPNVPDMALTIPTARGQLHVQVRGGLVEVERAER